MFNNLTFYSIKSYIEKMGGVPVKHHSHGKVGRRRSHLALKKAHIFVCPQCKGPCMSHCACAQCGAYIKRNPKH